MGGSPDISGKHMTGRMTPAETKAKGCSLDFYEKFDTPIEGSWCSFRGKRMLMTERLEIVAAEREDDRAGLAHEITEAFWKSSFHQALDLSQRPNAPQSGNAGMPEVVQASRLRTTGAADSTVRLFLTFMAAMDRARDADRLWSSGTDAYASSPWIFDPDEIVQRSYTDLADVLRDHKVSQRHMPDTAAWRTIAETLTERNAAPDVYTAIVDGQGDAEKLLRARTTKTASGTSRLPYLAGPKVGPMWIRMLAWPGNADITSLSALPVAVDVQVRKITEYLGVADTGSLDLDEARRIIQDAWQLEIVDGGTIGPPQLGGTAAALDPALWFYAKWGCTWCEHENAQLPISDACRSCRFPNRQPTSIEAKR